MNDFYPIIANHTHFFNECVNKNVNYDSIFEVQEIELGVQRLNIRNFIQSELEEQKYD